jgi:hypothetical protein
MSVVVEGVQMSERTRSEGWQFAKLDGHRNEEELGVILRESPELTNLLHEIVFQEDQINEPTVLVDGSKHVPSILGSSTTSKIDIDLVWARRKLGLSVKKSNAGQVWLVGLDKFFKAVTLKTGQTTPKDVEMVLSLFIGGENLAEFQQEFSDGLDRSVNERFYEQQVHQNRLVLNSIDKIIPEALSTTFEFLRENLRIMTELMFFSGLASKSEDCAQIVIYNQVYSGPNVFSKADLLTSVDSTANLERLVPGDRNGGSTIQLPTGFLQMHKPQGKNLLQFHHSYEKVLLSVNGDI